MFLNVLDMLVNLGNKNMGRKIGFKIIFFFNLSRVNYFLISIDGDKSTLSGDILNIYVPPLVLEISLP